MQFSHAFSFILIATSFAIAHERKHYAIPGTREGTYINANEHAEARRLRARNGAVDTDPMKIALAHLKEIAPGAEVRPNGDAYTDRDTGVWHGYFTQTVNSLDIANARANVNINKDGTILSSGSSLLGDTSGAPPVRQAITDPVTALRAVIDKWGYPLKAGNAEAIAQDTSGKEKYFLSGVEGVVGKPTARLVYHADKDGLSLAWRLETNMGENHMITYANAKANCSDVEIIVAASDYVADASYKVFPIGINDPNEGERILVKNPEHKVASPNGWHTVSRLSFTTTEGNNGIAQENWSGDGDFDFRDNKRPDAGKNMIFGFPYDRTAEDPKSYINASITQVFYTANMMHDLYEILGFTEAAGNFEEVNTGPGGLGGDAVQLNVQDGSGYNNAYFSTPPDGERPMMQMFLFNTSGPIYRDAAFDTAIVIHEYTHGLSTRLTGGPANSECLLVSEAGGMGEGWGDFFGTALRIKPTDTPKTDYTMGAWANGEGLRRYPYSTSLEINPTVYSNVGQGVYVDENIHGVGSIWANMLYEALWVFEEVYGYNADPFPVFRPGTNVPTHGRQLLMKLVLEGMKLQPCNPTFLTARNAIIDADKVLTGGDNECLLWAAFAKRGLGAKACSNGLVRTDSFEVPPQCSTRGYGKRRVGRAFRY